jgi:hypothetical protein
VQHLVERRAVRAIVLVLALGIGGVAGAPTMALPPRGGVSISGGLDDEDDDEGGGGGDWPDGRLPIGPRDEVLAGAR